MYYKKKDAIIIENTEKSNKNEVFLTMNIKTKEDINTDNASLIFSELIASGGSEQFGGTGDLKFADDIGIVFGSVEVQNTNTQTGNENNMNVVNKRAVQTKNSENLEGTKEGNVNKQKSGLAIIISIIIIASIITGIVIFIKIKKNKNYK